MRTQVRFGYYSAWVRTFLIAYILFLICSPVRAQSGPTDDASRPKLKTGIRIPELSGVEQFGKRQSIRITPRSEGPCAALLPLGGLVTVLQIATGPVAECTITLS